MRNFQILTMIGVCSIAACAQGTADADGIRRALASGSTPVKGATKTIAVVDSFFANMPAIKVTVPAGWSFDGAILRSSCGSGEPVLVYRAYSADGLTGIQSLPQADWYAAADERVFQQAKTNPCNLHAPARAADVAPKIATDLRGGAQVEATPPPSAKEAAELRRDRDQAQAFWQRANQQFPPNFRTMQDLDEQRVRIRYGFEGHPVEEMLTVRVNRLDLPVSVYSAGRTGMIQPGVARMVHMIVHISSVRAPAGKLDATLGALEQIVNVQVIPEWQETVSASLRQEHEKVMALIQKNSAAMRAQSAQFAAQMQRQNDQFHAWQAEQGARNRAQFAEHMRQKDANAQNFLDYVKDQTYYVNPATGVTMTLPNLPGVNGYAGMTPSGNWVELVPISH